jgi:hypothetical protein
MSTNELAWFKSSYSSSGDGDCVEIAWAMNEATPTDIVRVRDSKDKQGPQLAFSPDAWRSFITYAAQV